jgi:hypothetical protein
MSEVSAANFQPSTPFMVTAWAITIRFVDSRIDPSFEAASNDLQDGAPQDRFAQMSKFRDLGQTQFKSVESATNEFLATLDGITGC